MDKKQYTSPQIVQFRIICPESLLQNSSVLEDMTPKKDYENDEDFWQ